MSLRFRTFSEVVVAWILGAVLALLVALWPATEPCPHHQACAIEPMPLWQRVLMLMAFLAPGLFATIQWFRSRRSMTTLEEARQLP